MAKLVSILNDRFRKKQKNKIDELSTQATAGNLTSFAGVFGITTPPAQDREKLKELLEKYADDQVDLGTDIDNLLAITSEVKAITNQAAILHGERIKRAQQILKRYREGAFTAWLLATYGNRQTPYNFLQYYDFYTHMPKTLHPQIESMPRQAVYTLASRNGDFSQKEEIVRNYKGETKQQMITLIRTLFPLDETDRRRENIGDSTRTTLTRLLTTFEHGTVKLTKKQKRELQSTLSKLRTLIDQTEAI